MFLAQPDQFKSPAHVHMCAVEISLPTNCVSAGTFKLDEIYVQCLRYRFGFVDHLERPRDLLLHVQQAKAGVRYLMAAGNLIGLPASLLRLERGLACAPGIM